MERFRNSDWLSPEEFKFIADTSKLLNKCIDRKYTQHVIDQVSEDNMHILETNLAEDILQNYNVMKKMFRRARQEYLSVRLRELQAQTSKNNAAQQKLREYECNKQRFNYYYALYSKRAERLLKGNEIMQVYNRNYFVRMFIEILKNRIQKKLFKHQSSQMERLE